MVGEQKAFWVTPPAAPEHPSFRRPTRSQDWGSVRVQVARDGLDQCEQANQRTFFLVTYTLTEPEAERLVL